VDGGHSVEHYYACHDKEQADRIKILGTEMLRGKLISDVGCGAGSFLDLVGIYASKTVAIEPCREYHPELEEKGHAVYSYTSDALRDYKRIVDVAVSFAVLEHVSDPLSFLKEIKQLLKPEGVLLLCTPNYDDWLIDFLPESYAPFFFRNAHRWYFNGESIKRLAHFAGFNNQPSIQYVQRFDLSNTFHWVRDNMPTGLQKFTLFEDLDVTYQRHLARIGRSDYLYAWLQN
ncbi:MAG: class I SAM-dependent methyltransferase, partial [Candidatus Peribacteraceae bacterium]|nr:class I SAM-dependent methyltransferase [Candidatus Peribacteraceae bacterium]